MISSRHVLYSPFFSFGGMESGALGKPSLVAVSIKMVEPVLLVPWQLRSH